MPRRKRTNSDSDESYAENASSSSEALELDESDDAVEVEKPAARPRAPPAARIVGTEPMDVGSTTTNVTNDDQEEDTKNDARRGPVLSITGKPYKFRPHKRRKAYFYQSVGENADDTLVPSHERKTVNGGYAHTTASRSRISKANSGNTPWNKGKNRSSADRAKIAAGVRARNRAILLDKLKRLGLTEEEWLVKKKEIKYLRERIRRAKANNKKHEADSAQKKLNLALQETESTADDKKAKTEKKKKQPEKKKKKVEKKQPEKKKKEVEKEEIEKNEEVTSDKSIETDPDSADSSVPQAENTKEIKDPNSIESPKQRENVFVKDIIWDDHEFDGINGKSYGDRCPEGGPGGLICCEICCKLYSSYLTQTAMNMETQKKHKTGKEVGEILNFLKESREMLDKAAKNASTKIPPLPPRPPEPDPDNPRFNQKSNSSKPEATPMDFQLTSTIDIDKTKAYSV